MMPVHLVFTCTVLFHGTDPAALMLGLLFLHRAVRSNRAGDAWLAGVMVGLGWYGYWGARSLPFTIALVLLLTARPIWRVASLGAWTSIGLLATIAPLLVTYLHEPPLLGWPEALFLVLGGAGLVATLLRTRVWQAVVWLVVPGLVLTGVLVAGGTLGDICSAARLVCPAFGRPRGNSSWNRWAWLAWQSKRPSWSWRSWFTANIGVDKLVTRP